jgi:hypothetical protein
MHWIHGCRYQRRDFGLGHGLALESVEVLAMLYPRSGLPCRSCWSGTVRSLTD